MSRDHLRRALEQIKRDEGRVCDDFEICHRASSYAAWQIAADALEADAESVAEGQIERYRTTLEYLRLKNACGASQRELDDILGKALKKGGKDAGD